MVFDRQAELLTQTFIQNTPPLQSIAWCSAREGYVVRKFMLFSRVVIKPFIAQGLGLKHILTGRDGTKSSAGERERYCV